MPLWGKIVLIYSTKRIITVLAFMLALSVGVARSLMKYLISLLKYSTDNFLETESFLGSLAELKCPPLLS